MLKGVISLDLPYVVTSVPRDPASLAVRAATLRPIVNYKKLPVALVSKVSGVVRNRWRAFLQRLYDAGWVKISSSVLTFQYMRNCPPCGVQTGDKARCCNTRLCPYCHGRRVVQDPAYRLERILKEPKYQDIQVVEFRSSWYFDGTFEEQLAGALMYLRNSRWRAEVFKIVPNLGGYAVYNLQYQRNGSLKLYRQGFVLLGKSAKVQPFEQVDKMWILAHKTLTAFQIPAVFARAARYPTGWLQYAPPGHVIHMLDSMRRVRTSSRFGIMREQTQGDPS